MSNVIIDRRESPGGKNSPNRQKFVERAREQIKRSIRKGLHERDITDTTSGQNVKIKRKSVHEPQFRHDYKTGDTDFVRPGNDRFSEGDQIPAPPPGQSGQAGKEGSDSGDSTDDFEFALSHEEFVDILFEDLELPDMIKKEQKKVHHVERQRSGFSNEGNPAQLNLEQSMRNSIGRRIALKKPKLKRIKQLEEELEKTKNKKKREEIQERIDKLKTRAGRIPFLDPTDLRYNNYIEQPKPYSQAVVFCIMDVSASMGQYHKDLAKRFFMLLNLFVGRKYKTVECVFIRHHHAAHECNEEEFFYSRESGGTVVSSAYELMDEIIQERYPPEKWNIYCAQGTDGDNFVTDNAKLRTVLEEKILPIVQYLTYIRLGDEFHASGWAAMVNGSNALTNNMKEIARSYDNVVVREVTKPAEVYPIFRDIFGKKK